MLANAASYEITWKKLPDDFVLDLPDQGANTSYPSPGKDARRTRSPKEYAMRIVQPDIILSKVAQVGVEPTTPGL